ncbi:MAG TPA: sarcosine oxidase subunit gamma family protein [Novosphingobium sp.]|nr:sarcosine oxidase subunit gamma family protein [Novosphingobium sp.]
MADTLARLEPVPTEPAAYPGVTVALAPPMRRWSLRARDPKLLEKAIGRKVPRTIGETLDGIACLGPDEWLWRSAEGVPAGMAEGQPVSIVDVSERSVAFRIEGPLARAALNAGCPRDLERFAVGQTRRTVYEGVEIILHRAGEEQWTAEVWRSFAEWFWLSLNAAAAHP